MAPAGREVGLSRADGRRIWLHAQRLDQRAPFGTGAEAALRAIQHLGYVQIDTIHVIERCHHHILFTRIPTYRPAHLQQLQAVDKSVFEYWTHALSYLPTADFAFFVRAMRAHRADPQPWFGRVEPADLRRIVRRIEREGPLSIRDIDDDTLVDKDHEWASRKPSKRALQLAFFNGQLAVSARQGMVKTHELLLRHFGWERLPRAATAREYVHYLVARALRAQGVVSVDSVCHIERGWRGEVLRRLQYLTRRGELRAVRVEGAERIAHWAPPHVLEASHDAPVLVHLLSPFDPLVIQRDRLERFFGYRHLFEAYVPAAKRRYGYFALPVLVGDRIAAAIDLKADREAGRLSIQRWTAIGRRVTGDKSRIEEALHTFEHFQCGRFAEGA